VFGIVQRPETQPLDTAIDDLAALDVSALNPHEAGDVLVELRREQARLAAVAAGLVARVDAARPWAESGFRNSAAWLAHSDNTAVGEAHRDVRLARRLRTMPATRAALTAGDVSEAHAQRLAVLNAPDIAAKFGEAEDFLVGQARCMRWADFMKATEYWLRQAREDSEPDPDRGDRERRHVHLHEGLRGTGLLAGELDQVGHAIVGTELARREQELWAQDWAEARARLGEAATPADVARTPAQRRHDALVEMAKRSAAAPKDGRRPRPLVTVLVGWERFKDMCELADGTVISPVTAGSLLDEAVIERIVFDGPSRVLDLGRARSFTGAARRAVEVRDRHCTERTGCDVPASKCDVDHIWRYSDGGPTHPDNGRLRCPPDNRAREKPPPPSTRVFGRDTRTHEERLAHAEMLRARIRDRVEHDPAWATS
jgi:hypothetical protein